MIIKTQSPLFWNAKDFHDMTRAKPPIRWPVSYFYNSTTSPRSSLQPFLTAKVLDITCFRATITHLFLMLRIEIPDAGGGSGTRLWARCERLAPSGPNASLVTLVRDHGREALDTICISDDPASLHQKGNNKTLRFQRSFNGTLMMLHVVDLLHGMHHACPRYSIQTHSCWWFTATVISVLDLFGPEFSINNGKDFSAFYLRLFRLDANKVTRELVQHYFLKWFPGAVPVNEKLGTLDMRVDGEKRLNGPNPWCVVSLDTLPEPLSGVMLESPFPVAHGSYSVVLKGSWKSRLVALKLLSTNNTPEIAHKRFKGEMEIWRGLQHRNVLPFFGHYIGDNGAQYMVSPWCQNGDINNYLRMFPKTNREMLILQLLHGLEYLHKSGVIHGDLRGSNILISDDHEVCIADFGLSKYLDRSPTSTVNRGNIRWMAPELLDQELPRGDLTPYNEATDIFSFAMTTIEIYTGSSPFHHLTHDFSVAAALSDEGRPSCPGADDVSHDINDYLWDIIRECWAQEPSRRPSASDVKERLEAHRDGRLSVTL